MGSETLNRSNWQYSSAAIWCFLGERERKYLDSPGKSSWQGYSRSSSTREYIHVPGHSTQEIARIWALLRRICCVCMHSSDEYAHFIRHVAYEIHEKIEIRIAQGCDQTGIPREYIDTH